MTKERFKRYLATAPATPAASIPWDWVQPRKRCDVTAIHRLLNVIRWRLLEEDFAARAVRCAPWLLGREGCRRRPFGCLSSWCPQSFRGTERLRTVGPSNFGTGLGGPDATSGVCPCPSSVHTHTHTCSREKTQERRSNSKSPQSFRGTERLRTVGSTSLLSREYVCVCV